MICTPHQISGDKIKKREIGEALERMGQERCICGFCGET